MPVNRLVSNHNAKNTELSETKESGLRQPGSRSAEVFRYLNMKAPEFEADLEGQALTLAGSSAFECIMKEPSTNNPYGCPLCCCTIMRPMSRTKIIQEQFPSIAGLVRKTFRLRFAISVPSLVFLPLPHSRSEARPSTISNHG